MHVHKSRTSWRVHVLFAKVEWQDRHLSCQDALPIFSRFLKCLLQDFVFAHEKPATPGV